LPAFWLDCSNGNGFVIVAVRLIQVSLLKQSSNLLSDNRDSGSRYRRTFIAAVELG